MLLRKTRAVVVVALIDEAADWNYIVLMQPAPRLVLCASGVTPQEARQTRTCARHDSTRQLIPTETGGGRRGLRIEENIDDSSDGALIPDTRWVDTFDTLVTLPKHYDPHGVQEDFVFPPINNAEKEINCDAKCLEQSALSS
ncbi:hypothetical protein KM043_005820 [Ampulex compressa]|nr:hypothetical protein KM043_005820 [Ampulex compressa]